MTYAHAKPHPNQCHMPFSCQFLSSAYHRSCAVSCTRLLVSFLFYMQYEEHEEVVLWMNTVGPYHNRQETYAYFSLPFCKGTQTEIGHYHETLGEALQGVELEFSGLPISFKGMHTHTFVCTYHSWFRCRISSGI